MCTTGIRNVIGKVMGTWLTRSYVYIGRVTIDHWDKRYPTAIRKALEIADSSAGTG